MDTSIHRVVKVTAFVGHHRNDSHWVTLMIHEITQGIEYQSDIRLFLHGPDAAAKADAYAAAINGVNEPVVVEVIESSSGNISVDFVSCNCGMSGNLKAWNTRAAPQPAAAPLGREAIARIITKFAYDKSRLYLSPLFTADLADAILALPPTPPAVSNRRFSRASTSGPALKIDWVNCPICDEPDMRKETFDEDMALIHCTNHGCPSNGAPTPPAVDREAVIEATGGNIEAARKQAGHSDSRTTQRYSRGDLDSNSKVAVLRVNARQTEKTK
jgi:hypothetical protein